MVKLGKLFSILVVFALLILLAPAVVLTGQNVGAAGEPVTEEIEASFSFSVDSGGEWHTFQAGSGGVQPVEDPRLALVQYTRQNVVIPGATANVPGCGFRNYTTGSGTVASTLGNLNGTMTLEWIAVRFNQVYSHTPIYMTTTDFGWMWGRGHYDEGGGDNFVFVFIADLDCNDDMTSAAGKGFIQSVEENGRFGSMANPPELRHHIMGDLDIALSGGTYTGSFHLRNYPPNEVYDVGPLNITGGVLQEWTDNINPQLRLMNVTTDGPMDTPYDTFYEPGFEEIDWGKDPIKYVVDSARLGSNGTMDLTRNTILYLNQTVVGEDTYIHIQANPACVLYIDDTYATTGNDTSAYGELWEILLLSLPYQEQIVDPGDPKFFNQSGYTFCPFGTVNGQPTSTSGMYVGAESFADAEIYIQATVGTAYQYSYDISYGLYAHPKVEKVFPSNGFPNTTMDVKIYGKYFLRANNTVPNSGSVDFGPGITVNSYTINTNNPIDNSITASITIAPGASLGARDVNVTSCFGYSYPNGAAPYKSGLGTFNIVTEGSTLEGHVSFAGRGGSGPEWIESFEVKGFEPGNLDFEVWSGTATTNETGVFTMPDLLPETYDIGIKNSTCLSELATNVTLNSTGVGNFSNREGDIKPTDKVDGFDVSMLSGAYGSRPGDSNWKVAADLNRSEKVDGFDVSLLSPNYGVRGAAYGYF